MSLPSNLRHPFIAMLIILPVLPVLFAGCGLTGGRKLAEDSDPDAIVKAIAESERAEENRADAVAASDGKSHDTSATGNSVTRRAFGESVETSTGALATTAMPRGTIPTETPSSERLSAELLPPIPLRTVMPVSTETNILEQAPAAQMQAASHLTDSAATDQASARTAVYSIPPSTVPPRVTRRARPTPQTVTKVDTASFQRIVVESEIPVLVDFYTDWCGPCKRLAPELEQFARNEAGLRVVKVNAEHEKRLAQTYRVRSYPTVILFNKGVPIAQFVGTDKIRQALRR